MTQSSLLRFCPAWWSFFAFPGFVLLMQARGGVKLSLAKRSLVRSVLGPFVFQLRERGMLHECQRRSVRLVEARVSLLHVTEPQGLNNLTFYSVSVALYLG